MKQFTAYHVVAFFGVLFLILCADGIMDAASPAGLTATAQLDGKAEDGRAA